MDFFRQLGLILCFFIFSLKPIVAMPIEILEQISNSSIPEEHTVLLAQILDDYHTECERLHLSKMYSEHQPEDPILHLDAQSIYRIEIHQNGTEATVFQANPACGYLGNIWRATGSVRTFLLVGGVVYENWLSGPPQTLRIDGQIILVLPLTPDQCFFLDESVLVDLNDECYAALIWEPTGEDFYGYGTPLMLNHEI